MIGSIFNDSATELTTSATDAILAIECVVIILWLKRVETKDGWRVALWCWIFALIGFASILGSIAHGFIMPEYVEDVLWKPLYLSLGISVALFMVGAVHDWKGDQYGKRLVPWGIVMGSILCVTTVMYSGAFLVFVVYDLAIMLGVFAIYIMLEFSGDLRGAAVVAIGVMLNLIATGVQASDVSLHLIVPFDHNGVFHLVQMLALGVLGFGLVIGMAVPDTVECDGENALVE
jgi:hypothetical protein